MVHQHLCTQTLYPKISLPAPASRIPVIASRKNYTPVVDVPIGFASTRPEVVEAEVDSPVVDGHAQVDLVHNRCVYLSLLELARGCT